jgi:hypothetical protein
MRSWRLGWLLLVLVCSIAAVVYGCGAEARNFGGADSGPGDATVEGSVGDGAEPKDASPSSDAPVDAVAATYTVSGFVTGLKGAGLELGLGAERLTIAPADGGPVPFAFKTKLPTDAPYAVIVEAQPSGPPQICGTIAGSGKIGTGDVTDIEVSCDTVRFALGGQVQGLLGNGLVLRNNGADNLSVNPASDAGADGGDAGLPPPVPFTFATKIESGSDFDVSVFAQPTNPSQTCDVSGAKGTVVGGDVNTVTVNCTTNTYTVGGNVTGLAGTGLKLKNNGGDEIAVNALGQFSFPTPVPSGTQYLVTVSAQPTNAWQTCTVTSETGTVGGGKVNTVAVDCITNTYSVGGGVSGLADGGSGVKLTNDASDASDEITVTQNGPFTFPTKVPSGQGYDVEVSSNPTNPWQTCLVTSGSGPIAGSDVKDLSVVCTMKSFTVGGNVTGLVGSGLKLKNNGADEISVPPTDFTFPTAVLSGQPYDVKVSVQPVGSICNVSGGSGQMLGANVINVQVGCTTGTIVGGQSTTSTQPIPPDTLLARSITIGSSTKAYAVGGFWSSASCSVKYALYADSAGAPGTLLGTTGVATTTGSGATEAVLATPVTLAAGTYWLATLSQTACNGHYEPTGGNGYAAHVGSVGFAGSFPDPYGTSAAGGAGFDLSLFTRTGP